MGVESTLKFHEDAALCSSLKEEVECFVIKFEKVFLNERFVFTKQTNITDFLSETF